MTNIRRYILVSVLSLGCSFASAFNVIRGKNRDVDTEKNPVSGHDDSFMQMLVDEDQPGTALPPVSSPWERTQSTGSRMPPDKRCKWKQSEQQLIFAVDDAEAGGLDSLVALRTNPYLAVHKLNSTGKFSKTDIWACHSEMERTVLVGPFHSEVAQWHSIVFPFNLLKRNDCIVSFSGDTVSASDAVTPIPYPPLHMHHIHVEREVPHWWETHGDYSIDSKEGYNMSLPHGTCMMHNGLDVHITAHVNDVRFLSSNAGCASATPVSQMELHHNRQTGNPYSWYLRIKFLLGPQSTNTPINKLILYYPMDDFANVDKLQRYNAGNTTQVMFWPITIPYSGDFLPATARLHSHRARYAGYVLVKGNHTLESLIGLPRDCHLTETCNSIAAIRQLVLERAGSRVLCQDNPKIRNFVTLEDKGDGQGGKFDRQGSVECKPFSFTKNDVVTVFSFATPVWAADMNPFPQHTILFGYYRPLDNPFLPIEQLYPDTYGRWVLGDAEGYKEALVSLWHAGNSLRQGQGMTGIYSR